MRYPPQWEVLVEEVNGRNVLGAIGVRDPNAICEDFDGLGYNGKGECHSDGHYLCKNCSHLSPKALQE